MAGVAFALGTAAGFGWWGDGVAVIGVLALILALTLFLTLILTLLLIVEWVWRIRIK